VQEEVYTDEARVAAVRYLRAGYAVIPIPQGSKNPNRQGWQNERHTVEDVPRIWNNGQSVGVLLGEPSGGLADVDLDAPELGKVAGRFLSPTLTSGRDSAPDSHWWYRLDRSIRRREFTDLDGDTILELRGTGHHTLVPPSVHPSGERLRWSQSGLEIAGESADELLRACRELAAAGLVARTLPPVGGRHRFGLALAGFLLRRGLNAETLERIMLAGWDAAGFESDRAKRDAHKDIEGIISGTEDALAEGTEVIGGPTLDELRPGLTRKIARYLGWSAREREPQHPVSDDDGFALTDLGNSERLVARHGGDLRYFHGWRKWFVYDGKRWCLDDSGAVKERGKDTVRSIYEEAAAAGTESERKALADHAKRSESRQRVEAMISLAESSVPVQAGELDTDPWMLNVENGTVDLSGELREHRRENMITKLAPVEYDPDAKAPIFDAFLKRILPSEALRKFMQRAIGYAAAGIVSEEVLVILYGTGANGKSTLVNIIMEALGDYAMQAAPELLRAKRGSHPTELADLFGARLVASVEVDEGRRLAESLVKQLTGRDPIKARRMREDFWQFDPTHTVFLATNHRPEVRGTDHAIWRRIKLVPFEVTIPESEQDKRLVEKLRKELPGILAWIVQGCLEYQRGGLGEPDKVRAATLDYRSEMDVLAGFIEDRCVVHPRVSVGATPLYHAYKGWCEETGEDKLTQQKFGRRLKERGFTSEKTQRVTWYGIGLHDDRPDPDPDGGENDGDSGSKGLHVDDSGSKGLHAETPIDKGDSEAPDQELRRSRPKNDISVMNSPHEGVISKKGLNCLKGLTSPPPDADLWIYAAFDQEGSGPAKNLPLYLAGDTTLRILTNSVLEALHRPWQQMSEIEHRRWERLVENAARQRAENEKGA